MKCIPRWRYILKIASQLPFLPNLKCFKHNFLETHPLKMLRRTSTHTHTDTYHLSALILHIFMCGIINIHTYKSLYFTFTLSASSLFNTIYIWYTLHTHTNLLYVNILFLYSSFFAPYHSVGKFACGTLQ